MATLKRKSIKMNSDEMQHELDNSCMGNQIQGAVVSSM